MDNAIFQNYINSLRFFTGDGREILMQKQNSVSWEIIPNDLVYSAFLRNPSGHLEASLEEDITDEFIREYTGDIKTPIKKAEYVMLYTYTFQDCGGKEVIHIYRKGTVVKKITALSDEETKVSLAFNIGTNQIDIISSGNIIIRNTTSRTSGTDSFMCIAYQDTEYSLKQRSLRANVVVDEPGIIQPSVQFYRKECDKDYIRSHSLLNSKYNICALNPDDAWKEIPEDSLTYSINNVYDIIFFGYKSISDGEETVMSNTLRITVTDGENTVQEDYKLEDFFVGTKETCKKSNLKILHTYTPEDEDVLFIENPEDIINHSLSKKSEIYGLKSSLIALTVMAFYEQWDKELLKKISDFIQEVRIYQLAKIYKSLPKEEQGAYSDFIRNYYETQQHPVENSKLLAECLKYYSTYERQCSDKEILAYIVQLTNKYGLTPEYWDSSSVLAIVKDLDATGNIQVWPDESKNVPIAKELLSMLVYSDEEDIIKLESVAYYVLSYNIPESQYPYVRYVGSVLLETVSACFVEPQTIVVVSEDEDRNLIYPQITDGSVEYRLHFRFQQGSEMFFIQMQDSLEMNRSETLFALLPSEINLTDNPRETNALHFTTGFEAEREGCYQNTMGIFLKNMQTDEDFFVGAIIFKTQVEAEDERYRTLLENFGIPDPNTYPNIFREQDPDEQGKDWRLINKKSKELMLSYDNIFPYAGTYRALFRAMKFLGYDDIVFKEWYKILDKNDTQRYVAILNFDVSTGKSIKNVLKSYGVEYLQYQRYTKLNRLAMIYHLQEIALGEFEDKLPMYGYVFTVSPGLRVCLPAEEEFLDVLTYAEKPEAFKQNTWKGIKVKVEQRGSFYLIQNENNQYLSKTSTALLPAWTTNPVSYLTANYTLFTSRNPFVIDEDGQRFTWTSASDEIPLVKNIYEFRNDEILTKLYQVKLWIERYITGVGCYISDINGESIILERIKTQAWATDTKVNDMTSAGRFTPRAAVKTHTETDSEGNERQVDDEFTDSSINVTCSLNEFRSLTIDDYADFPIERFVRWQYDASGQPGPMVLDVTIDDKIVRLPIYPSPTFDSLTVADEYEYTLHLDDASSGSLYEFADSSCLDNPIVVAEGEITLFDETKHTSSITNSKEDTHASNECPIIEITKGNVREVYGDWAPDSEDNNVAWSIVTSTGNDGNYYVRLTSQSDEYLYETDDQEMLEKYRRADENHIYPRFLFKGGVLLTPEKDNARFEYTDVNQWGLPMIIVKGYYPSNQMPGDYAKHKDFRAADEQFFPRNRSYVIEILEGSIHFRNHKKLSDTKECKSADIIFSEGATQGMGEQVIQINYAYSSDRLPIVSYPKQSEIEDRLTEKNFEDFQEMYDFLDSFVKKNTEVNIPVNRLGEYTVSVKAFDAYNNTYAATGDDPIMVSAKEPQIDIIVNQSSSQNDNEFYPENLSSESSLVAKLTNDEKLEVNSKMDEYPKFPRTYKIYSAVHDTEEDEIVYDNISYAIDTPKKNDRIILTNMTEQVLDVSIYGQTVHFGMKNGNPEKQNIFNTNGTITICVWSEKKKSVIAVQKDVVVIASQKPHRLRPDVIYENGYVEVDLTQVKNTEVWPFIKTRDIDTIIYIIDTTEINITDGCENIKNGQITDASTGEVTRLAFIPVKSEDADNFKPDMMVKIRIEFTDDRVTPEKMMVNESAYRVLELTDEIRELMNIGFGEYGYLINGHIDICAVKKFPNTDVFNEDSDSETSGPKRYIAPPLKMTMKPLHSEPVEYELIVTEDAQEIMYVYQDYKFYGQKTVVKYDDGQLMFAPYMDDQYAAMPMKYDPIDLIQIWNPNNMESDVDYYRYRDFPISVDSGRYVIIKGQKTVPQLKSGWKTLWRWKTYAIRDMENLRDRQQDDLRRMLLFESNSEILTIKPEMLGSQSAELYLIDLYGNIISNTGGGNLYVRDVVENEVENVLKRETKI